MHRYYFSRTAVRDAPSQSAQSGWLAERLLDRSGVPVIHLQRTLFTAWLMYFAQITKASNLYIKLFGAARFSMVGREDIAAVAVLILPKQKNIWGQSYQL